MVNKSAAVDFMTLEEAIATHVQDGNSVALEGFTHAIPFSAGKEIIRQGRKDLELIRMTPDLIYDMLIGAGCARRLVFSWGGNPGAGSLYRFRDAVENQWPVPLELEEHTHAVMANRYIAGASGLPFAVLRAYRGTDLPEYTENTKIIMCPFTGEELLAVAALKPDVTIIHAQQADRKGNIHLWGIIGAQREALLCARTAIVTVEEIVDEIELKPGGVVIPSLAIDVVCVVPGGAHPSYAYGYYDRDNSEYLDWINHSQDREAFEQWLIDTELREPVNAKAGE